MPPGSGLTLFTGLVIVEIVGAAHASSADSSITRVGSRGTVVSHTEAAAAAAPAAAPAAAAIWFFLRSAEAADSCSASPAATAAAAAAAAAAAGDVAETVGAMWARGSGGQDCV